ncbi:hypothetical protein FQR65_LT15819 [Abscondita terminalis]|nr:hypothetical protein FQR65_LT15819 [Abscondita terminalis]
MDKQDESINYTEKDKIADKKRNKTTQNVDNKEESRDAIIEIGSSSDEFDLGDIQEDLLYKEMEIRQEGSASEEFDLHDLQESLLYKEMQRRNELEKLPMITKHQLKNAFSILKEQPKAKYKTLPNKTKRYLQLQKFCINKVIGGSVQESKIAWFSPTYIMELIRTCILNRNWDNVTHLLLMLLKHHKRYSSFIKKTTLLMLMSDPNDDNEIYLNEFLQLLNMKLS